MCHSKFKNINLQLITISTAAMVMLNSSSKRRFRHPNYYLKTETESIRPSCVIKANAAFNKLKQIEYNAWLKHNFFSILLLIKMLIIS